MKRYTSIGLSMLVLITAILGALAWVIAFSQAVQNYRSPLREADLPLSLSTTPQTGKVVVVLISGLGYEASLALSMPALERLRQTGVNAAIQSSPPTYAQTAWMTLLSGAPADTNDAVPIDVSGEKLRRPEVDTVLARAQAARLRTALLGGEQWDRLLPGDHLDLTLFMDNPGPDADELIYEAALPLIKDDQADLILIHFSQMDLAAQSQGGPDGQAYQRAAAQIDAYLREISAATNLSQTTLIVLADYGHISTGGHGGNEVEVVRQPLIMTGAAVTPGNYSDVNQTDLAPTISTLLGLAPPRAAQGRILVEMLRLDNVEQALARRSLAQQRVALATAYMDHLGLSDRPAVIEPLYQDLDRAHSAFEANNIAGAAQLAQLVREEADAQIRAARSSLIQREQWKRLPLVLLLVLIWSVTLWRRRGYHAASIVTAVLATLILYHTLYQLQGYSYSISSIAELAAWPAETARRTTVSLAVGGGLLLIFLMLTKEENWVALLGAGYGFGVLTVFVFSAPFLWGYWHTGWGPSRYLPEVGPVFWQFTAVFELITAAILGLILPWPIMISCLFVNLIRRRLVRSQPQPEADALPGLHL